MAVLLPDCLSATTIRLHGAGHGVRKIFCTVQPKLVLGTVAHRQYSARVIRRAGADSDGGQPKPAECPDARSAIELGRERFASGDYEGASAYFEKALDLPGTGTRRFRDKPPILSAGEKQAALYNLACCYAQTDDIQTGLTALAGCLENGYANVEQVRSDPDLAKLREDPRFEGLIKRLVPTASPGILGRLLSGFQLGVQTGGR